ncbi:rod shape-determining protein MreC [Rickettsia endosymbiont of Culicoides newsteadi]|uniref:rod shape-determining protein MreC n=1 Tax=Rickettsia endosymbiont of Culicoides newsteadi TaxID=1961830 RepID=UPI000B9BD7A0|nr:rod shape-determining protein MreC [Rickettsia endosymbiont of Culicoides newsteadi]OZG31846.1 rod shape-determining protein MreC [Rickettsia endosymbiont of Culicoides newsteadi]
MALLANRIKNPSRIAGLAKFILVTAKRGLILFFTIASLYLFIATPKRLSSMSLEIVGHVMFSGLLIHENVFKQINLITQNFIYLRDLARENIELQLEVARLRSLQSDIYLIQSENRELKQLLSVIEEEQYSYVSAKLLSVSLNPFSKTALLSAGAKHGVAIDQIVTNSEGLVGRVIQVSNNYSKIILVNDVNSRIPITTTSSKEKGIMSGYGNGSKILYLPKNHLVQKAEKVITSGYGNIYPYGITVGYVNKANSENVLVKPIVDLSKTKFVSILLPQ